MKLFWFVCVCLPAIAHAQAGPPFFTNDPGTPGNGNWEINIASAQSIGRATASYQIPQIDLNFGLGERVQLTYEIPYVLQTGDGQRLQSGWGNAFPGIKWRVVDQGEEGWQMSVFPQVQTNGTASARRSGIATSGPRYLLPIEVTKRVACIDLDFEAGYYFPKDGVRERILGLVASRSFTERFDLGLELYSDRAQGAPPNEVIMDIGGRYKLATGFIALFMAGRSIYGTGNGQPEFTGYLGLQILLSDYGRSLTSEPPLNLKAIPSPRN
jgi:hypothetical protein